MKIKVSTEIDGYLKADHLKISTTSIEPVDVGEIVWNQIDKTFDMGLIGGVTLQAGQEMHIYGKATEAISNGEAVMFAGVQGDHLLIARADATIINANPEYLIGVSTQSFITNQFGYVTTLGNVRGLNTLAYTLGTILYYNSESATDGLLTATEPTAPNAKIEVAAVVKVHGTQGILLVRPHVMPRVKDLQDIHAPSPTQAKGLFWNNTNSRYENYTVPEILGYTPANDSDVVHISGYETITGAKTFNDYSIYKGSLILSQTTSAQSVPGYMSLSGTTSGINLYDGSNVTRSVNLKVSNVSTLRNIEFPNESGTLALTSDLSLYALDSNVVHLTGNETITGTKTFNGTLNTTTSIFNLAAVDNFPTAGVPDAIRASAKGHNGTSTSLTTCFYGLIENNKNAGIWIENLSTAPDSTNSIGFRSSFKSTSTGNNFFSGERGATNVFRVNDYGDIYGTKTILGTTVDNTIDTLQVNGSARIVNIDPTGIGGITTKLLSYSANPYGLVFRAYATGEHSIQNQRESNDATVFPLLLQPLGGDLGVGTLTPNFKFHVVGNGGFNSSLDIQDPAASSNGTFRLSHDSTGSSLYSNPGSNNASSVVLRLGINNSEKMRIANNGNVGINTTATNAKLSVEHSVTGPGTPDTRAAIYANNIDTSSYYGNSVGLYAKIQTRAGAAVYGECTVNTGYGGYFIGNMAVVQTTVNPKLTLQYSPSGGYGGGGDIDIVGGASDYVGGAISWKNNSTVRSSISYSGGGGRTLGLSSDGNIGFSINGGYRMYLNSSGYLGIGTTAPSNNLHVVGTVRVDSTATTTPSINVITPANATGYYQTPPTTLTNQNFSLIRTSGTINGNSTKMGLYVSQGTAQVQGITIPTPEFYLGQSNKNNVWLFASTAAQGASQINSRLQVGYDQWLPDAANTNTLSVGGNGYFTSTVSATGFVTISDNNLKEIISKDGDTVRFTWKNKQDYRVHIGYIAQEIQKTYPDQVHESNDGTLSVNYIEVLVAKIQQLENRIKQLENK